MYSVQVRLVDEGKTQWVLCEQLKALRPCFQDIPFQAVEVILCRMLPVDKDTKFSPSVRLSL